MYNSLVIPFKRNWKNNDNEINSQIVEPKNHIPEILHARSSVVVLKHKIKLPPKPEISLIH